MVAGRRPLDNKIDTELQHLTTSVTATKFLKKFKADLEICDAMEEQVCDVPSQCQCPVLLGNENNNGTMIRCLPLRRPPGCRGGLTLHECYP